MRRPPRRVLAPVVLGGGQIGGWGGGCGAGVGRGERCAGGVDVEVGEQVLQVRRRVSGDGAAVGQGGDAGDQPGHARSGGRAALVGEVPADRGQVGGGRERDGAAGAAAAGGGQQVPGPVQGGPVGRDHAGSVVSVPVGNQPTTSPARWVLPELL